MTEKHTKKQFHETTEYLEMFLRNLLLDEKNELHNRSMHISGRFAEVDIEGVKVDIESGEVDIERIKVDIERVLMPFAKLPKTNLRTDIVPNSLAVFIMILHYKSVTKYQRTRHMFTKSNGLYVTS